MGWPLVAGSPWEAAGCVVVAGSPDQGKQVGISLERQALKGKAHSKLHFHL